MAQGPRLKAIIEGGNPRIGRTCLGRLVGRCITCGEDHLFDFFADQKPGRLSERSLRVFAVQEASEVRKCILPLDRALVMAIRAGLDRIPMVI